MSSSTRSTCSSGLNQTTDSALLPHGPARVNWLGDKSLSREATSCSPLSSTCRRDPAALPPQTALGNVPLRQRPKCSSAVSPFCWPRAVGFDRRVFLSSSENIRHAYRAETHPWADRFPAYVAPSRAGQRHAPVRAESGTRCGGTEAHVPEVRWRKKQPAFQGTKCARSELSLAFVRKRLQIATGLSIKNGLGILQGI